MSEARTIDEIYLRIYLTGFMGSGKTTVGAALARRIGYVFIDLDQSIVEQIGMPIASYFQEFGEARFRRIETEVLHRTQEAAHTVIAVGGGALVSEGNLAFARKNGLVVFLMVDQEEIVRRLRAERDARPMLLDDNGLPLPEKRVEERIARLYAAREPYYHRAHLSVDVGRMSIEEAADRLLQEIQRYMQKT